MTVKDPSHTPGPWRVAYRRAYDEQVGEFGCVVSLVIDDQIVDLGCVGIIGGNYEDFKRAEANARLIAAAPEMYQLLSELEEAGDVVEKLCVVCHQRPGNHLDWCDIGRVLRIARGEAS